MQNLVSIITPCYNAADYIAETIKSVQSQTYKAWEMIIVDDSSSDNSAEIIQSYSDRDKRIKYLRTTAPQVPHHYLVISVLKMPKANSLRF